MKLIHLEKNPIIHSTAYIHKSAQIIGDVNIEEDSSIWFNAVVRGDVNYIKIGKRTNIQDGCLLHVTKDICPLILHDDITVGHGAILHGCTIHSRCLISMGAIILDNVEIGEESIIGAGALVKEGTKIPPRSLVAGVPAKIKRELNTENIDHIKRSAKNYLEYKNIYIEKSI